MSLGTAMANAVLTTEIDPDLKRDLEGIARLDGRSPSEVARLAIGNYVEERKATRGLVQTGLKLIQSGAPSHSDQSIHDWFLADDGTRFPAAQ